MYFDTIKQNFCLKGDEGMMTEQEIKEFISRIVLKTIPDAGLQTALRRVLYDNNNKIDWFDFYEQVLDQMPEYALKGEKNED